MVDPTFAALIGATAFLPPLLFLAYVRNQEKTRREPWGAILFTFIFGAVVSVLIALALESLFHTGEREYELLRGQLTVPSIVFLVVVVAPLVEEFAKGLGVRSAKRYIVEEEDGIVYGAAAGFGFSATENLFYEIAALAEHGEAGFLLTALVRTFTGTFLHATATGILGYGLGRKYRHKGNLLDVLPYYALAVLLHAAFNLVAVLNIGAAVGFTVLFAFLGIRFTVQRIRRLDQVPAFASDRGLMP